MHDLDVVARVVEHVTALASPREMRGDQDEVGVVEPPQQIVERPLARRLVASRRQ
jgi:hypothetical protein